MRRIDPVITGIGVVSSIGTGKDAFWQGLEAATDGSSELSLFDSAGFSVKRAAEVRNFDPKQYLGPKGLRNIDRGTLFLLTAAKMAIEDSGLRISDANTDKIGLATGTTFTHLSSIVEFDTEVFKDGIEFSNPALFPSNVVNAASSQVSIRFNIQGFNATISTGYTSGLEALRYGLNAIATDKAATVFVSGVEALIPSVFFGFHKIKYMAGFTGEAQSCPFDKRRNGPVLGEGAGMICLEDETAAKDRGARIYCRVKGASGYFDAAKMGRIHPQAEGLEKSICQALSDAGITASDIDYVSSCANSSLDLDRGEVKALRKVFGKGLDKIPVSAIKSMLGETFSAAGILQIISCIRALNYGIIPPTINFKEKDEHCGIDCVANKARSQTIKKALVLSSGPGGYNSACVLEKYQ